MIYLKKSLACALFVTASLVLWGLPTAMGDASSEGEGDDYTVFEVPFATECNGEMNIEADSSNPFNMHTNIRFSLTVCIGNPTNDTIYFNFTSGNTFTAKAVNQNGKVSFSYPPEDMVFAPGPVNISVAPNTTADLGSFVWDHVPNGNYTFSFSVIGYDLPSQNRSYLAEAYCSWIEMGCSAHAASGPSATPRGYGAAIGFTGGLIAVAAVLGLTEPGKYASMALMAPLFTRLKKKQVLDNFTRGRIEGYVMANPGAHMNAIRDAFELSNGVVAYHLRVLEREGFVTSMIDGLKRRFYPGDKLDAVDKRQELSVAQNLLISIMEKNPGIAQTELAKMAGTSPQVVNYHIRRLWRMDLITMDKDGRLVRCTVRPEKLSMFKRKEVVVSTDEAAREPAGTQ